MNGSYSTDWLPLTPGAITYIYIYNIYIFLYIYYNIYIYIYISNTYTHGACSSRNRGSPRKKMPLEPLIILVVDVTV